MTQTVPNSTIEDAISTWVAAASGLTVYWEGQDAPRPAAPYISMLLATVDHLGEDWQKTSDNPLVFADKTVTEVDDTANTLESVAHGLTTQTGPVRLTVTGGTLPTPLAVATDYWVIRVDADLFKLAESRYLAGAGTAINLSDEGTGVIKVEDTANSTLAGAEITTTSRGLRKCRLLLTCFAAAATGATDAAGALGAVAAKAQLPQRKAALRGAGMGVPTFGTVQVLGAAQNNVHFEPRAILEVQFFAASEVSETGTYIEFVGVGENVTTSTGTHITEIPAYIPSNPAD